MCQGCETGPTVYRPYPRGLESLITEPLYIWFFQRNSSRDDSYWCSNDLTDESDNRIVIPIKFDNVCHSMKAKKCGKKCTVCWDFLVYLFNLMLFYFLVSVADMVAQSLLVVLPCNTIVVMLCDNFALFDWKHVTKSTSAATQCIQKGALSPQLFKDPECWPDWSLNPCMASYSAA